MVEISSVFREGEGGIGEGLATKYKGKCCSLKRNWCLQKKMLFIEKNISI